MRRPALHTSLMALAGSTLFIAVARAAPSLSLAKRARLTVIRILSGPEFQARKPAWYERWLDRFLEGIANAAEFVIEHQVLRLVAGAVALTILVLVLLYVLRVVSRSRVDEVVLAREDAHSEKIGAIGLRRRAEEAASGADYRRALRFLYLSFLADLRERGLLSDRADLTNWEYIGQLRENGARRLIDKAEALTKVFEKTWYGQRPVSRDDFERFSFECER